MVDIFHLLSSQLSSHYHYFRPVKSTLLPHLNLFWLVFLFFFSADKNKSTKANIITSYLGTFRIFFLVRNLFAFLALAITVLTKIKLITINKLDQIEPCCNFFVLESTTKALECLSVFCYGQFAVPHIFGEDAFFSRFFFLQ